MLNDVDEGFVGLNSRSADREVASSDSFEKEPRKQILKLQSRETLEEEDFRQEFACNPTNPIAILPPKCGPRVYRLSRWIIFTTYRRLFLLIMIVNIIILSTLLFRATELRHSTICNGVAANLLMSNLLRQDDVINLLFIGSERFGKRLPLRWRRQLAKIYTFGGIHSGCGVAAVMWYLVLAASITRHLTTYAMCDYASAFLTYLILILLLMIIVFAQATIRIRIHNWFEASHRFAGWAAISLLWAQTILVIRQDALRSHRHPALAMLRSFSIWTLAIVTILLTLPWIRLRRIAVTSEVLSRHAVRLHFLNGNIQPCQSLRLAMNPLKETHAFVAIPEPNGNDGFSTIISAAGDWTNATIQSPPSRVWIKGAPFYGVLRLGLLFTQIVLVATGSGIAPCLSLLSHRPKLNCRLIWSTPSPIDTYGHEVLERVLDADPSCIIVDTRKDGRPDLIALAYAMYQETNAEAVFVVSNMKVTRKVIYGLESRGVAAYGPIFDS